MKLSHKAGMVRVTIEVDESRYKRDIPGIKDVRKYEKEALRNLTQQLDHTLAGILFSGLLTPPALSLLSVRLDQINQLMLRGVQAITKEEKTPEEVSAEIDEIVEQSIKERPFSEFLDSTSLPDDF